MHANVVLKSWHYWEFHKYKTSVFKNQFINTISYLFSITEILWKIQINLFSISKYYFTKVFSVLSNLGDLGSIPESGRSPGGGHGNPLQYSCLENPHGQRSLVGYSPWGHKESDTIELLSTAQYIIYLNVENYLRKYKNVFPCLPNIPG